MITTHQEFWELAEENNLSILTVSQMTNAPIKVLLEWLDNQTTPESALNDLKKYLK
jgi:hypothetical protein